MVLLMRLWPGRRRGGKCRCLAAVGQRSFAGGITRERHTEVQHHRVRVLESEVVVQANLVLSKRRVDEVFGQLLNP